MSSSLDVGLVSSLDVDETISSLLSPLNFLYGIWRESLRWKKSYPYNRYHQVAVHSSMLVDFQLHYGVTQVSAL